MPEDADILLKALRELATIAQGTIAATDKRRVQRTWDYSPEVGERMIRQIPSSMSQPSLAQEQPVVVEAPVPPPNPGNRKLLLE